MKQCITGAVNNRMLFVPPMYRFLYNIINSNNFLIFNFKFNAFTLHKSTINLILIYSNLLKIAYMIVWTIICNVSITPPFNS